MLCNQNRPSSPTPYHLRQRRSRHQNSTFQPTMNFGNHMPAPHGRVETLDLSIHLPPPTFTTPAPEPTPIKEFHVPPRYRRSRNSRGTKEAKRRRDARRSRRKLAAQMLDEQLSRDIDWALSQANHHSYGLPTPPSSIPSPTPMLPTTSISVPRPTLLPAVPPSPVPQLPALEFPGFGVNSFPQLAPTYFPPTPPAAPLPPTLPSWCPALPAFTRNGIWSDGLPIFYDLSCLPEPKEEMNLCRELQLWRGNLDFMPKQSRFFPTQSTAAKAKVKLPPTGCKLHKLDAGLSDSLTVPPLTYANVIRGCPRQSASAPGGQDGEDYGEGTDSTPMTEPSAANLWRILASNATNTYSAASRDPYLASFGEQTANGDDDQYFSKWQAYIEDLEQPTAPAELDGREVPYVHTNSLTGIANDLALSPYMDEHPALKDSGVCLMPLPSPAVGLNEMLVDYDVDEPSVQQTLPNTSEPRDHDTLYPTPSSISHTHVIADLLPVDCVVEADGGEAALEKSDAQFNSQQSLFELPSQPSKSVESSIIDIATFLKMGHAKDCWCNDCDEIPELVSSPEIVDSPELIAVDKLTEMDDDWMLYSAADDQSTAATTCASTDVDDEEKESARLRCGSASEWDAFFPTQPTPAWKAVLMKDGDGHVRSSSGEESDWIWDVDF